MPQWHRHRAAVPVLLLVIASGAPLCSPEEDRPGIRPDRTAECLASVHSTGDGRTFAWTAPAPGHPAQAQIGEARSGVCSDVQASFGLCGSPPPPRECLVARVPWQTALSVARCCFTCCQASWQDRLGLSAIYRHWWENPAFAGANWESNFARDTIPPLDAVAMHMQSVKRFSLFMWDARVGSPSPVPYNATHLVSGRNGGGGVAWLHGPEHQAGDVTEPFSPRVLEYVRSHPVSVAHQSDSWKAKVPLDRLGRFAHGGKFVTTYALGTEDPLVLSLPLGCASPSFEAALGDRGANRAAPVATPAKVGGGGVGGGGGGGGGGGDGGAAVSGTGGGGPATHVPPRHAQRSLRAPPSWSKRGPPNAQAPGGGGAAAAAAAASGLLSRSTGRTAPHTAPSAPSVTGVAGFPDSNAMRAGLLMCCCMTPRAHRGERVAELEARSGGVCSDREAIGALAALEAYAARLASTKFALSMVGHGRQCFRDTEALLAGAVPILDGHISGGPHLYDDSVPALHAPICGSGYCRPSNMTVDWLEAQYAALEARRDELNVAKAFWPFWLYHVFLQVPG